MAITTQRTIDTASQLQELARLYGVQTSYKNALGREQQASMETLMRVLRVLGASLERPEDAPGALRAKRREIWQRVLEPAVVAWEGEPNEVSLRLTDRQTHGVARCRLILEDGNEHQWDVNLDEVAGGETETIDGTTYRKGSFSLPARMPNGYHRLEIEIGENSHGCLVIAAPRESYSPPQEQRTWGVFLPLYALRTSQTWGAGTFTDLGRLIDWVQSQGGNVVGTLPLMAAFLDEPFECSPYSPASRLFWNEFYLDVQSIPELGECAEARAVLDSTEFKQAITGLQSSTHVDYRREMAIKRRVLEKLSNSFFASSSPRRGDFDRWLSGRTDAEDYARFRAVGERLRSSWMEWPARLRDGAIHPGDFDDDARKYHLYVQWIAEQQLEALADKARQGGAGLYLDLPLGVNGASYDVWRERGAFAVDASGGCPPDVVFRGGQDWGFPPLHPEGIRAQGYRYVISYLRRQLAYAGILRIDHMPVFHRLWWVPRGMAAKDGVYVIYPAEELYAIFSLESHRHKAVLVGEDLGTVPPEVPESMADHNVHRMYVIQYALTPDPKAALPDVPANSVASVNNHDMPPFKAYWDKSDIEQREKLGLLGDLDPEKEKEQRKAMLDALVAFLRKQGHLEGNIASASSILRACLRFLASSGSRVTLVGLEDLWEETEPQNIPSTGEECGNWTRKTRYSLEEFIQLPAVNEALKTMNHQVRIGKS